MKIAVLGSRGIPARYGGFETMAEEVSVRLAARGVDVSVFCMDEGQRGPAEYKGVRLLYVRPPKAGPATTILFDLICLWRARTGYDAVYMLGYGASLFCFIPRLWGSAVWLNMDGVEWARSKWGFLAKTWFKAMEAVAMVTPSRLIADAEGIRTHLASRHRRMAPCSVVSYGAPVVREAPDTSILERYRLRAGGYYLVVCRLEPENQILEIAESVIRSSSPYPLIVVGDCDCDTAYIRRLKELDGEKVRLIGTVYDKQALQALRYHAFAYFHGHTVGGTNPSLLEAMGCGNLIVAHDNVFNREVAGDAALYFKTPADIVSAMAHAESDSNEALYMMKDAAKARIRDVYNWDRIVDTYFRLLSDSPRRVDRAAARDAEEPRAAGGPAGMAGGGADR